MESRSSESSLEMLIGCRDQISSDLAALDQARQLHAEKRRQLDALEKERLSLECELASLKKIGSGRQHELAVETQNTCQLRQRLIEKKKEQLLLRAEEEKLEKQTKSSYAIMGASIEDKKEGKTIKVSPDQLFTAMEIELKKKTAQLKQLFSRLAEKAAEHEDEMKEYEKQWQRSQQNDSEEESFEEEWEENQFKRKRVLRREIFLFSSQPVFTLSWCR